MFSSTLRRSLVLPALASLSVMITPVLRGQGGESGEAVYKKNCSGCHGPDGSGATQMGKTFKLRDLRSAEVQQMSDAQLTDIVSKGKGKMPAYGARLDAAQLKSVVGYIRQLAKTKK